MRPCVHASMRPCVHASMRHSRSDEYHHDDDDDDGDGDGYYGQTGRRFRRVVKGWKKDYIDKICLRLHLF